MKDADLGRVVAILRGAGHRRFLALEFGSAGDVSLEAPRRLPAKKKAIAAE